MSVKVQTFNKTKDVNPLLGLNCFDDDKKGSLETIFDLIFLYIFYTAMLVILYAHLKMFCHRHLLMLTKTIGKV